MGLDNGAAQVKQLGGAAFFTQRRWLFDNLMNELNKEMLYYILAHERP